MVYYRESSCFHFFICTMNFLTRNIISTVLLLVVYVANYLSSSTDILWASLSNLGEIFPFAYMPPGRTFGGAWWLIYLSLWIYVIWSWTQQAKDSAIQKKLQLLFRLTCLFNITWLVTTGVEQYISAFFIILGLLIILWYILTLIKTTDLTKTQIRTIAVPFGLYYGWVSIATSVLWISQVVYQFNTWIPLTTWRTVWVIALWVIITIRSFSKRRNRAQLLIAIRAFTGVAVSLFM